MQWFPVLHLVFDYIAKLVFIQTLVGAAHCFAFHKPNPNPTSSVFVDGFSPREGDFVVHTFTSKITAVYEPLVQ